MAIWPNLQFTRGVLWRGKETKSTVKISIANYIVSIGIAMNGCSYTFVHKHVC